MSRIVTAVLVVLLAPGVSCAGRASPHGNLMDDVAAEEGAAQDFTIQVVSRNSRDVNVYLYVGSSRQRLGLAGGNTTTVFKVPWSRVSSASTIRLRAERIGDSTNATSDPLQVKPGGVAVWTLESQLGRSTDAVY